ncbi:nuclear transcription factor Y subunit gamma [Ceratitis capitata]|uniref:nuclear transcription factor Y subunit gamma n=1 Tax=Ceratitis capitata TaxID=7213 RepID=UPI00032A286D|nr:nuclear transcription factor Y subunit gamma [Ceratitis capitata]
MSHSYSNAPSSSGGGSVTVAATSSGGRHGSSNNPAITSHIISSGTYNISGDMVVTCSSSTPSNPKEKQTKAQRTAIARRPPPTIDNFWQNIMSDVRGINQVDAKHQALPLARIKKIMKLDENAKMIAAEAPLLFAKACEYFIQELTMRAWIHTEESKRRTLQRSDIAQAIANYDQFDFLIDIVPREDIKPSTSSGTKKESPQQSTTVTTTNATPAVMTAGTVTLPVKMETAEGEVLTFGALNSDTLTAAATANQPQQPQQTHATIHAPQQLQIIQQPTTTQPQQLQYFITTPDALNAAHGQTAAPQQQLQIIQQPAQPQYFITTHQPQQLILTAGPNGQFTATPATANPAQHQQATILQNLAQHQQQQQPQIQLLQQVVTPTGEVTNVPIAINANQLNLLRLQMQPQATQQLLQLNNATNVPVTTTSHNVAAAHVQAQQQHHHVHQQQPQQQQQQQHTNATSIFINATPQAIAAVQQHTQQAQQQQQQHQQQQQQQQQHINVAGATIIATDRNLSGGYRPNC